MSSAGRRFRFHPEWRLTLFTLIALPLLVGLGCWQLQRAQEKAALEAAWAQSRLRGATPLERVWDASAEALAYRPVTVSGQFLHDRYFLLDNRVRDGKFGYEAVGIVRLDGGGLVLVNRGWLPGDPSRRELPAVPAVEGRVGLTGYVYVAPGKPFLLGEQDLGGAWPLVLQALEPDRIRPLVEPSAGDRLFPYPVRIDAGEPGALVADWPVLNVSPDRHRAYAAQWFTMALVLLAFYLVRSSNLRQLLRPPVKGED